MITRFLSAAALVVALFASMAATAAPDKESRSIDFGGPEAVIELKDVLGPYHAPARTHADNTIWYMLSVTNASARPAIRVLLAGQPASASLSILPHSSRPAILSLASSDPGAVVETAQAYGRHAYRVTVPPATTVGMAVEVANAEDPPSLLAWTEPALASHNRQLGIFVAAIAGLIFAAAAITGGLAVMTGHAPPRWAALTLLLVLLLRLAGTGMFDASVATRIGGPFGLAAFLAGLALVAGARLTDSVVPLGEAWPWAVRWFHRGVTAILVLSALAYLGVPAMAAVTDIVVLIGTSLITLYLVHRGGKGIQAARVVAPSAAIFALVALASAIASLGGLGSATLAPDVAGGFSAAGAVLLALAVATGEGIAVLPLARPLPVRGPVAHALEAIGASRQGIFDLDFTSDKLRLSREASSLLGLADGSMAHAAWIALVHDDDRTVYKQALTDYRQQNGLAFRIEFRVRGQDSHYLWFELRATMLGDGEVADRCLGLIADVTMRKESEAAIADHTLRDPLTGLGNRVALMEALEALGPDFTEAILALLDIDRFKSIHASLGDAGGDALLKQVARRLEARFSGDVGVFRAGGDSFAVLFHRPTESVATLGLDMVDSCATAFEQDGRSIFAPASVGATVGHDARDPLDLIKNAELALTQAKQDGGACARVYAPAMSALVQSDSVALETELRSAIANDQLEVFYQPIVRLTDGVVAGFEALLRWRHPERGLVSPDDFIAHSEETGLIVTLGRLALERAARDLSQWQRFFPLTPPLFASVNFSRRQLRDPGFEKFLKDLLQSSGIAAGTLKLELTETSVAADVRPILMRLRALGAGLSIDDFGTGQSSLSQLKDLPFDTVKIDKSFLSRHGGTHNESDSSVVLSSMVALAHDLRRDVVVEGVETKADAELLLSMGCEFAQGFYFSPALQMTDALNYIARHCNPGGSGAAGLGGKA